MSYSTLDIVYKIASIIVPIVAMFAIYISIKHLKKVGKDTRLNTAYTEIDIFEKLSKKQDQLYKSMLKVIQIKEEEENKNETLFMLDVANKEKIDFLNLLDTVCLYVRNGCITRSNFKKQYKQPLKDIIETYKDNFDQNSAYDNIKILNEEFNKESLICNINNNMLNMFKRRDIIQASSGFFILCIGVIFCVLPILNENQDITLSLIFPHKYTITQIVYCTLLFLVIFVSLDRDPIKEASVKSLTRFFTGMIFLIGLYYLAQQSNIEELKDIKSIKNLISLMITFFYIFFIIDVAGITINLFFIHMPASNNKFVMED